jgi:hypothetical protein
MPVPDFSPGEVLTAAAMDSIGLWLVKTQTIGTGVSSVTVTDAFSADYDNYKIILSGGVANTSNVLNLTLGSTATGYYRGGVFMNFGSTSVGGLGGGGDDNAASFSGFGLGSVNNLSINADIYNPFASRQTEWFTAGIRSIVGGLHTNYRGFLDNTTSYTAFTLTTNSGTMTGGTIRVYGYRN